MKTMDAKVLRRAAEIVDQGWCRGAHAVDQRGRDVQEWYDESNGAVAWCAYGAMDRASYEVLGLRWTPYGAESALAEAIGLVPIVHWNDAPGRTADEVAAALRAAADRCETA